jgi:kexin
VSDDNDEINKGLFLGWNMAFWGSAIDASKAKKYYQPVVVDSLPPTDVPYRPILNDPDLPTETTHSKPTDHLPSDHGSAMSPQLTGTNSQSSPTSDNPSDAWYSHMATLVSAQKWFFAGLGAASVFLIAALVYFWRRRVAQNRLAEYTSLAANDIHMEPVRQTRVPGNTGRLRAEGEYDEFEEGSREHLVARSEAVVVPSAPVGLGFHSGFLDDDEPSATLSPKYRDDPETPNPRPLKSSDSRNENE